MCETDSKSGLTWLFYHGVQCSTRHNSAQPLDLAQLFLTEPSIGLVKEVKACELVLHHNRGVSGIVTSTTAIVSASASLSATASAVVSSGRARMVGMQA